MRLVAAQVRILYNGKTAATASAAAGDFYVVLEPTPFAPFRARLSELALADDAWRAACGAGAGRDSGGGDTFGP